MAIFACVMAVISLAMSVYAMANQQKFNQEDGGIELQAEGANQSINMVYGRARLTANKIFEKVGRWKDPNAEEGDWLTIVGCIGQGPFYSLKQIYINGTPALTDNWRDLSGDSHQGTIGKAHIVDKFKDHVQIQFNMGQKPFFYKMVNDLHPEWDNTCVGNNIASVAIRILRDPYKGEIQNSPTIEVEVHGRLIRDIRMENSAPAYNTSRGIVGQNPALCMLDYITSPYGLNIPFSEIDEYSFIQYANYCDGNKLTMNGVVDQGSSIKTNLEAMFSDFNVAVTKPMNYWRLIAWIPDVVQENFTEDDILDKDIKVVYGSSNSAFNRLEVEYADPNNHYQKDVLVYPAYTTDEIIDRDGYVVTKKVEAKFTNNKAQVDKVASLTYESTRNLMIVEFKGNEKAFNCQTGDIVTLTHSELQFNKKQFKVMKIKRSTTIEDTATAEITLAEYSETAFDTVHVSNSTPGAEMPVRVVPEPRDLKFTITSVGATFEGRLEWTHVVYGDFLEYVVEHKLSSAPESEWQRTGTTQSDYFYVPRLNGARYDFRVFTRSKFMESSAFSYLYNVDVKDDTVLPKVTGLKLVTTNSDPSVTNGVDFQLTWDSMDTVPVTADKQIYADAGLNPTVASVKKGYEIEIYHGANGGKYKSTVITTDNFFNYSYLMNSNNGLSRYVTFKVRLLSKGGSKSKDPAVLNAKNLQALKPTGVLDSGSNAGIQLSWDTCTEQDFRGTNVYCSRTRGFTPLPSDIPSMGEVKGNFFFMPELDGTWFCRVAHFDAFGVDELNFSPEMEVSATSAFHQMTDLTKGVEKEMMDNLKSTEVKLSNDIKKAQTDMNTALKLETDARVNDVTKLTKVVDDNKIKAAADIIALRSEMTTADGKLQANIDVTNKTMADKDKALAESITSTEAKLHKEIVDGDAKNTADLNASVKSITTAYTDADKALASQITTVQSDLNGTKATVQTHSNTIADINGTLKAEHYMKVQADGKYAGMGLIADSGTKSSKIIFAADQMLFVDPSSNSNKPIMEIRNGKVMIVNGMIDNLDSAQIRAGAISAAHIKADAINANHISANVQLRTPDLLMDSIRLNSGAAGFGKGNGPYSGWGEKWGTIIYANGQLCTNNIQASGGVFDTVKVNKATLTNCVISEDCTVNGYLYADRIIGLPAGKSFGLSRSGWVMLGAWTDALNYDVPTYNGRFDIYTMPQFRGTAVGYTYGPAPNVGGYLYCNLGVRVLVNKGDGRGHVEQYREMIQIAHNWEINHPQVFSWAGNRINCGSWGANVQVQYCVCSHGTIQNSNTVTYAYDKKFSGNGGDVWLETANILTYSCVDL